LDADDASYYACDSEEAGMQMTQPRAIPYTRAAKARIDRAERQGKAREEQLEMLQAVRAYMASKAANASRARGVPSC